MRAIYRREIYSYFVTPHGYAFLTAFALVSNVFFYFANVSGRSSDMGPAFQWMLTMLLFCVPILTMRSFSEEYRRGTDKLLFSSPVSPSAITAGKLTAALTMLVIALLQTAIWAEIAALFGEFNPASYAGELVALVIFASVYAAAGIFISSVCRSQVVAFIVTLSAFAVFLLADTVVGLLDDGAVTRFLKGFSLFSRYDSFARGLFSLTDLVYCISLAVFFCALTVFSVYSRRQGIKGGVRRSLSAILPALILIAAVNLFTNAAESRLYLKLDLTSGQVFSLSSQTVSLLDSLDEPVTVTVLAAYGDLSGAVYDDATGASYNLGDLGGALEKYAHAGGKNFNLRYIDPDLNPQWLRDRDLQDRAGYYCVVVESERRLRVLELSDMYAAETLSDTDGNSLGDYVTGIDLERALGSAILNVTAETPPIALFTDGHGEYPINYFSDLCSLAGYEVETVNLSTVQNLPDRAALIVISSPQTDFGAEELILLDKFLENGGNAVIALDPANFLTPNFSQYLREWGFAAKPGFVCSETQNYGKQNLLLPLTADNSLVPEREGRYILLAGAQALTPLWESDANRAVTPLLYSQSDSYIRVADGLDPLTELSKQPGDETGQFTLGLVTQRMVVSPNGEGEVGSYVFALPLSFLSDMAIGEARLLNRSLAAHWLSLTQPGATLDIPPRNTLTAPLTVSSTDTAVLFTLLVIAVPLAILAIGAVIWLRRRNR